jgi:hypothetical protein
MKKFSSKRYYIRRGVRGEGGNQYTNRLMTVINKIQEGLSEERTVVIFDLERGVSFEFNYDKDEINIQKVK